MIKMNADLSGIEGFIGSVDGILSAVQSPAYQGNFIGHMMSELRDKFMADSIAAAESGAVNIKHVFEWGPQDGSGISNGGIGVPLFRLNKKGEGGTKFLTYEFLPSTKPVPLPDPARYGFNPDKLKYLNRHLFKFKAVVMETHAAVSIAPSNARKLFIPDASHPRGYYMTSNPKVVNPGGKESTGAFTHWWAMWFETRAQAYVNEQTKLAEEFIKKTGQNIIRDATTGRFAQAKRTSFGYVQATKATAEQKMLAMAEDYYSEGDEF